MGYQSPKGGFKMFLQVDLLLITSKEGQRKTSFKKGTWQKLLVCTQEWFENRVVRTGTLALLFQKPPGDSCPLLPPLC